MQYVADTPNGAWAEFLRHEEIVDAADLMGISRALWAIDIEVSDVQACALARETMLGDKSTYAACQDEADRIRASGGPGLKAPSAALAAAGATGRRVESGLVDGPARDGEVMALFGERPDAVGWQVVDQGRPPAQLLPLVRHFDS